MHRVIDISVPVDGDMVVWPGNPRARLEPVMRLSRGDSSNVSELHLGTHSGTHVDPPAHFMDGGATAEQLALDALVGRATVADLTHVRRSIGPAELDALVLPAGTTRLLFKTRNSRRWRADGPRTFDEDFVSLSPAGAAWVVERGLRLVGTDFLSIEAYGSVGRPTHRTLLSAGVVIVEGLDLSDADAGEYTLACLPLKVVGADGSPARAVLLAP